MGRNSPLDPNQQLQYLSSTLQIYNPSNNLCLDDGGNEVLGTSSLAAMVSFKPAQQPSLSRRKRK